MPHLVTRALVLASELHHGQTRKYSRLPYILHPMRVADAVAQLSYSSEIEVAAAYLHDVIEDCEIDADQLRRVIGDPVTNLVVELTNTSKNLVHLNRAIRKKMDCKRLAGVSFMAKSIKILDRIDNLQDLDGAHEFCVVYLKESKDLMAALAENGDCDEDLLEQLNEQINRSYYMKP